MFTIRRAASTADWDEAAALLHDYIEWMRAATGFDPLAEQPALTAELAHLAEHYAAADALFLARWRGLVVGTVAVRRHEDGSAELKRMYLRSIARGRGIADALVATAVDAARAGGCHVVWLETVRGPMDAAIAAYRRNGFAEAGDRRRTLGVAGLVVMERTLAAARDCA